MIRRLPQRGKTVARMLVERFGKAEALEIAAATAKRLLDERDTLEPGSESWLAVDEMLLNAQHAAREIERA